MPDDKDQQQPQPIPEPTPTREAIEVDTSENSRLNKGADDDFNTKEDKQR